MKCSPPLQEGLQLIAQDQLCRVQVKFVAAQVLLVAADSTAVVQKPGRQQ